MRIDTKTGLLEEADYIQSPNADERPAGIEIDLIVIHCISLPPGLYGGDAIEQFFSNKLPVGVHPYFDEIQGLKVSAHILIRRDGSVLQFVPFGQRAWHAGLSSFEGKDQCNNFSIGIELEGTDNSAFEEVQYQRLAALVSALEQSYTGITRQRITGHSNIAPGRKTDPGSGFEWDKLHQILGISA